MIIKCQSLKKRINGNNGIKEKQKKVVIQAFNFRLMVQL